MKQTSPRRMQLLSIWTKLFYPWLFFRLHSKFLPRNAMHSAVSVIVNMCVCLSVRPSVRLSLTWTVPTWFDLRYHFHVQYLRNNTRYVYRILEIFGRLSRRAVSKQ